MSTNFKKTAISELALFLILLFVGLVILPLSIYIIGQLLFGEYAGSGFSDFYGMLHSEFRSGQPVVWFLIFSPYLAWQMLRLTFRAFRGGGRSRQQMDS